MAKAKKTSAPKTIAAVDATASTLDTSTTTTVEPVQLTIADLQLLSRIVDLASRRGAFQAGELSQVGDSFNKLTGFLAYVESVQATDAATEEAETPAVADEVVADEVVAE